MRKNLFGIALTAAFGLVIGITFSCSGDGGDSSSSSVADSSSTGSSSSGGISSSNPTGSSSSGGISSSNHAGSSSSSSGSDVGSSSSSVVSSSSVSSSSEVSSASTCGHVDVYYELYDARDLTTYKAVEIGGKKWMAENLNYAASGSKCYDGDSENCKTYGRLYDWVTDPVREKCIVS